MMTREQLVYCIDYAERARAKQQPLHESVIATFRAGAVALGATDLLPQIDALIAQAPNANLVAQKVAQKPAVN